MLIKKIDESIEVDSVNSASNIKARLTVSMIMVWWRSGQGSRLIILRSGYIHAQN